MIKFNLNTKSLGAGTAKDGVAKSAFGDDDDEDTGKKKVSFLPSLESVKISDQDEKPAEVEQIEEEEEDEESKEMAKVMGFGTFGRPDKPDKNAATATKNPNLNNKNVNKISNLSTTTTPAASKSARQFDIDDLMKKHQETVAQLPKPQVQAKDGSDDSENDEDNEGENESLRSQPGPSGVAANKSDAQQEEEDDDDEWIGPPLPPGFSIPQDESEPSETQTKNPARDEEDDDDDAYSEDEEDKTNRYNVLPISHEIELKHGTKSVTALALDPNGARLVTGGIDYELKYWDFQGMDSTLQSFRTIKPCQSHSIKHLEYNANGEMLLVISGSCNAKLVDRDGKVLAETVKGDQYITDKNKTKGHVAMLNSGTWHPRERNIFATTSNDATARLWDVNDIKSREIAQHKAVIKPRSPNGFFTQPNSVCFSPTGDLIALACNDGSVQMWDTRKAYINTAHLIRSAHDKNSGEISSIAFSYSGEMILSRGVNDSTLKLWDMRMLRSSRLSYTAGKSSFEPVHCWSDLFNRYPQTDCFFSPDDRLAVTGVGCDERSNSVESGRVCFFDCSTFQLVQEVKCVERSSVIRSLWHPKLNQLVISNSDGTVRMMYDNERSERGAKLCTFRVKRKRKEVYTNAKNPIITPHALPMFKEERRKSKFVQMIKDRKDPMKSHHPEMPVSGAGSGGRLASAGKTFASFIAKNLGVKTKIMADDEDPREALWRHAKEAAENPYWVTPAYTQTQPKTIFDSSAVPDPHADPDDDEYEVDEETGQRKRRKHVPV